MSFKIIFLLNCRLHCFLHFKSDGFLCIDIEILQTIEIENLPRALRRYAKQVDELNLIRIKEIFAKNFKNIRALVALLILAISIYFYTILAVKQETFLEEIDQEVAEEMDTKTSKK
ncbi:unnamed protein product [Dracunculus medinensis]|uniref:Cytochrome c oxidase assembly factor 3 n=1 Tax=Dracunculus medinensis TaxID=318479 RepID=A0A0N4U0R0_DRAME|nr:unnamed protein product [Dracunculus medinensis]